MLWVVEGSQQGLHMFVQACQASFVLANSSLLVHTKLQTPKVMYCYCSFAITRCGLEPHLQ
eukprot:m.277049 g.277049  ORF g.277049 m.277049 type:complete len:61 (-) comp19780_c0_seq2:19-201(-)